MESDTRKLDGSARPFLTEGIGRRISGLFEGHGSKKRIAEQAGISSSQLTRYISEESQPTIEPLARLAEAAGVCLEWLATGKGPKLLSDASIQRFDVETLQAALEVTEDGLAMAKRSISPEKKAELVAAVYDLFTCAEGKVDRSVVLRLVKSSV